jgi:hypothetical protein
LKILNVPLKASGEPFKASNATLKTSKETFQRKHCPRLTPGYNPKISGEATMIRRILLFASASLLLAGAVQAQDQQPSTDSKPAEAQPAKEPEKKPDAFQYFFGKKRDEQKKAPEAQKPAPEAPQVKAPEVAPEEPKPKPPAEPAPVAPAPAAVEAPAPAALEVRPEPPAVAAPILAPAPEPPKAEEPKADAFQYFFGHASQPLPEVRKEEGPRKPVTAFEYFFGKNGKADEPEPSPPR